ncbi:mRNA-degrading endonuclease [Vibrio parahaemolyticus]|uniref:endoribonuclease MazF n=1 Tax=Vibrio parahaemolyticus TaxID=670 RepID=UPI0002DC4C05|nr:endoribonuclease MazF [Vibrio parahaemolyticus]EHV5557997.1 endoribonuclease MazF [Vibrio parahaemolyticus]EIZ1552164.1 endoribonuclease MazF [Vibrio parahaemolyticus]ELB2132362.1 endoribonuclease MazF [Vibrio parahaemolyticus]ELB2147278.1 endoribonuclease MazF [Vibrio parahaemolyticus]ELB2239284.1 endoribonuclease MazF [Vibrio parahaemolyticus]
MTYAVPEKGDVVVMSFNPQSGHEQAGDSRPGLVISPKEFNQATGFALVCPITNQSKGYPFEVEITGSQKTTGVVLADQVKSLDWRARRARVVDSVSNETLGTVRDYVTTIANG